MYCRMIICPVLVLSLYCMHKAAWSNILLHLGPQNLSTLLKLILLFNDQKVLFNCQLTFINKLKHLLPPHTAVACLGSLNFCDSYVCTLNIFVHFKYWLDTHQFRLKLCTHVNCHALQILLLQSFLFLSDLKKKTFFPLFSILICSTFLFLSYISFSSLFSYPITMLLHLSFNVSYYFLCSYVVFIAPLSLSFLSYSLSFICSTSWLKNN